MKLRIIVFIILATILPACNLTLAEDVTPPPGYIPPTPVSTLVLVPPQTPNVANGEAIYFEKCAACHGNTGLGDGAQGIQLGVTVPAFALPEIARPASPAGWYTTVTRGKIERFMPPFVSLNDQERWDVVAYIMTLHTSDDEVQKGKELFEANCPNCSTDFYKDQGKMSGLSTVAVARIVRLGNDEIQAFGESLTDDEVWAVAEYLRSLTYVPTQIAQAELTPDPASKTLVPSEATPVETGQVEATKEAASASIDGFGSISGSIENKTGEDFPANLIVTLRGYEHNYQDPSAGTQEVVTADSTVTNNGSFTFEKIEIPEGRIFLCEVTYKGIVLSSDFVIVKGGQTSVRLPTLTLYDVTTDTSGLVVDELNIFVAETTEGKYEILALYSFRNAGENIVSVDMGDSQEISFLKFPMEGEGIGYEAVQDSAPFTSTADGFAMLPNEVPYGILAISSVTSETENTISQPLVLPVAIVRIFVPDGMEAAGSQITQDSPQDIQGKIYQTYIASNLPAGDVLTLTISGAPSVTTSTPAATSTPKSTLLIGAGGLGIALILAGAWMYLRDKSQTNEDEEEDDETEFESAEDVIDAIIAIDDLYRAKKISNEAYKKRRAELKEVLKEML